MNTQTKMWIGIGSMALLSPLGLLLPDHFKAGAAWGEWGSEEVRKLVGYVPQGLERLGELWKAPMPDYAFKGWEGKGLTHLSFAYILSGLVGAGLVVLISWLIGRALAKKG